MEEAGMVEELKKRGYRVSKPKKPEEPKEEFKPYKAIYREAMGSIISVEVIEEKPKTVVIKNQRGYTSKVPKDEIFEFSQEALDKYEEMWERKRELRDQEEKIVDEAWKFIDSVLKPRYKGTEG